MSEPKTIWQVGHTRLLEDGTLLMGRAPAPLDPTPGFEYVGTLETLPPGLRNVRFIGLSPDEIEAIRVAARLFTFAGDGIDPVAGLAYARVQPLLQDIARRLAPDDDHSPAQGGATP